MITIYAGFYEINRVRNIIKGYTSIPANHITSNTKKPNHVITIECTKAEKEELEKAFDDSDGMECPFAGESVKCEQRTCDECKERNIGWIITDAAVDYAESLTDETPKVETPELMHFDTLNVLEASGEDPEDAEGAAVAKIIDPDSITTGISENTIIELDIDCIENHPQNVRKEYTDIKELSDSIKARGILQNLTVVPIPNEPGRYWAVIGNRRLRAAREAGLKTVPCRIADMDEKEQVQTMLLENIQRNDLTIMEQADGFQMMLDLGETVDSLSEKTGFGKSTIYHRLNIAKLDPKTVKEKTSGEFQLSLGDFYALEQIEDVETRDRVLKEASDSNQLRWKADQAARQEKLDKIEAVILNLIPEAKKWTKDSYLYTYSGDYDIIKEFDLDKKPPKSITIEPREGETLYYIQQNATLLLFYKAKKQKAEPTTEELAAKARDRNRKEIKGIMNSRHAQIRDFILHVIKKGIIPKTATDMINIYSWSLILDAGTYISRRDLRNLWTGKREYDCSEKEIQRAKEEVQSWSFTDQMIAILWSLDDSIGDIVGYDGKYNSEKADLYNRQSKILSYYGWTEPEDAKEILDGTSYLYAKEEQNERN